MSPEKWNIENTIAMCVQEEERLKTANGCSINYVKDNKKRNYNQSNQISPSKPHGKAPFHHQHQQRKFSWTKIHVPTVTRLGITRKISLIG
jgi:hypothetical protein